MFSKICTPVLAGYPVGYVHKAVAFTFSTNAPLPRIGPQAHPAPLAVAKPTLVAQYWTVCALAWRRATMGLAMSSDAVEATGATLVQQFVP